MSRIVHLTSAHPRYDTRIFLKMCRSLATANHDVTLVVADSKGEERKDGVRIVDVGKPYSRLDRMVGATRRVTAKAVDLDADIYHIHDPELLPAGLKLKRRGKRVIFDAHEDLPRQILSKPYLHPATRRSISFVLGHFETYACRRLDAVIGATPIISDKFRQRMINSVNVNNFPLQGELEGPVAAVEKTRQVCYIGGMFATRGIRELVIAIGDTRSGARLALAGNFGEAGLLAQLEQTPGWGQVDTLGFLNRPQIRDVFSRSAAGLVTLHPTPSYVDSLPVKMFEYMSAGLPVIASNFPLWLEIIEGNDCGLCVDPQDPTAIAAAIDRLVEDPNLARRMGDNGRRAVHERYNWSIEERKLLALYEQLLSR